MNEIQKYMKKLNVLYVEDEKSAREMFSKVLNRQFTNVTVCENGLDGYLEYKKNFDNKTRFDLIISDINMPKMSGLELVEQVREEDSEVLVILVTARNEANVIMRALELQVTNYITKPMDINKTNEVIIRTCEKLYLKSNLENKQKELEKYTKTIEEVALVIKIDNQFNFTYVNDIFCSTTGFKKEEVLNKNTDILFKNRNEKQKSDMWESLKLGNTWKDTIKCTTSDNNDYYTKATIIPVLNENDSSINEFIFIGFITTDEEKKKQELNKRLLHNIADSKKNQYNIEKEKESYEENIKLLRNTILSAEERYNSVLKTNENLLVQLEAYESSKLNDTSTHSVVLRTKNDEIEKLQKLLIHLKNDKVSLSKKIEKLEETLSSKNHSIEFLEQTHKEDKFKIDNLEAIIMSFENGTAQKSKKLF